MVWDGLGRHSAGAFAERLSRPKPRPARLSGDVIGSADQLPPADSEHMRRDCLFRRVFAVRDLLMSHLSTTLLGLSPGKFSNLTDVKPASRAKNRAMVKMAPKNQQWRTTRFVIAVLSASVALALAPLQSPVQRTHGE